MTTTMGPWVADKFGVIVATNYQIGLLETICETPRCFALNRAEDTSLSSDTRASMARWAERCTENARLIAAAPDLLDACRKIVERWEHGDLAEAARACADAIRKATGEESCDVA